MIHDVGNVEYFELCETTSKVQCCFFFEKKWNAVYTVLVEFACVTRTTCVGWFRITWLERDAFAELDRLNLRSRSTITRAFNAWDRCRMKKDATGQNFTGILDILMRDPKYLQSQEEHGWDEAKCKDTDRLAQEDHSYKSALPFGTQGSNVTRPDYRSAVGIEKLSVPTIGRKSKNQSHHKIKTECDKTISCQKHTEKELESTRK